MRALLAWLFFTGTFFGLCLRADPVAESLKESRWYDYQKRDYYQFRPEDIQLPEREKPRADSQSGEPSPLWALLGSFLQNLVPSLLTALVAVIVLVLLYLLARVIMEQWGRKKEKKILNSKLSHHQIPESIAAEIENPADLDLLELARQIELAIQNQDDRRVIVFIYLYALLWFQNHCQLYLQRRFTPREYANMIQQLDSTHKPVNSDQLFSMIVRFFESALYRGRLDPEMQSSVLWQSVRDCWGMEPKKEPGD